MTYTYRNRRVGPNRVRNAEYRRQWKRDARVKLASRPYPASGRCDLCGEPETLCRFGKLQFLSFDHDHVTGKFRGWLCGHCNTGLGKFRDNPMLLRRAANYIEDAVLLS